MNNTMFENVVDILQDLLKHKGAIFLFENDSISLQIDGELPVPSNIDQTEFGYIMNEIVQITAMLLKNSLLKTVDYQGDTAYLQRISIVKNKVIDDKLIRRYRFFTGPVINPIKSIFMNPVIRPINSQFNLVTLNLMLQYSDGIQDKKINIEMNVDFIDTLIDSLEKMRDAIKEIEQKNEGFQFMEEIN